MLKYNPNLKPISQRLRKEMTASERLLWSRIRGKQVLGGQFYRQKPIGNYVVDFYAPKAKLVIEVDGSQHREEENRQQDIQRETFLNSQRLQVLRLDNLQVLKEIGAVVEGIFEAVRLRVAENPP
ncbi:MAG: endonuclease domain-containing protein [Dehalococcoidia bacterium]